MPEAVVPGVVALAPVDGDELLFPLGFVVAVPEFIVPDAEAPVLAELLFVDPVVAEPEVPVFAVLFVDPVLVVELLFEAVVPAEPVAPVVPGISPHGDVVEVDPGVFGVTVDG